MQRETLVSSLHACMHACVACLPPYAPEPVMWQRMVHSSMARHAMLPACLPACRAMHPWLRLHVHMRAHACAGAGVMGALPGPRRSVCGGAVAGQR